MLLDANLLLYAVHSGSSRHEPAKAWLTDRLNGPRRIGLPWQSLAAFLRIASHPRAFARPLAPAVAWDQVRDWLAAPAAWVPQPGPGYADVLGDLVVSHEVSGNLLPDAQLAALAIEHGVSLQSTDTDFARFGDLTWENPLA